MQDQALLQTKLCCRGPSFDAGSRFVARDQALLQGTKLCCRWPSRPTGDVHHPPYAPKPLLPGSTAKLPFPSFPAPLLPYPPHCCPPAALAHPFLSVANRSLVASSLCVYVLGAPMFGVWFFSSSVRWGCRPSWFSLATWPPFAALALFSFLATWLIAPEHQLERQQPSCHTR